jgi:hypothetical protein
LPVAATHQSPWLIRYLAKRRVITENHRHGHGGECGFLFLMISSDYAGA